MRFGVTNFLAGWSFTLTGSLVTCVHGVAAMRATVSSVHASPTVTTLESRTR